MTTELLRDDSSAIFSQCRTYRYVLTRYVREPMFRSKPLKKIAWVMLNPSTADEDQNDATIRRCMTFSKDWGYDVMFVVNLFPYCATEPAELKTWPEEYIIGRPGVNDDWINRVSNQSDVVMLAWGNNGNRFKGRCKDVIKMLMKRRAPCYVLGYTTTGHPLHPLMQPACLGMTKYIMVQ